MKLNQLVTAFALIAGFAGSAQATQTGLISTSAGSALWDTYPSLSFTNDAPDALVGTDFTATLSSALAGGMVQGGGDRLYSGSGPTPNAHNLAITGDIDASVNSFTLQIKFTTPSGYTLGAANVGDFFNVTSSLGAPSFDYVIGTTDEGTQLKFNIVAWVWTGLNLGASDSFTINIGSPANHVSIDAIRIDAAAIPEPSAFAALAGLGVLGLAASRRRRA